MQLTSIDWALIEEHFHAWSDLPAAERRARLAALRAESPAVADAVERLLHADASKAESLDAVLDDSAARLLALAREGIPTVRFGPYRAVERLGEGGMGIVYLAEREDVGARVALKVLWDAPLSPARKARFEEERRFVARLRHPGIVPLYDAGVQGDGTIWFAMEYVRGLPLHTHCVDGKLPLRARLRLFMDVCTVVTAAHQQLVVHGDLKPSNILVDGDGRVRLLDFGVSGRLDTNEDEASESLFRLLTPAYAAPERRDGGALTVLTDVYALGVMLFQLVADRLPVSPAEPLQLSPARAHGEDEDDLALLCATARAPDPAQRYQSVEALRRDLERFLASFPLEARKTSLAYRTRKFVRRRQAELGTSIALLTLVGAVGGVVAARTIRLERLAAAEATRTQRIQDFMLGLLDGANEVSGAPDSLRIGTLLEAGVRDAPTLAGDPLAQVQLLRTLGASFRKLGKLDRADTLLREAIARGRDVGDERDASRRVAELALLLADRAKPDSARLLANEAISLAQRTGDSVRVTEAVEAKGKVSQLIGRNDTATVAHTRAVGMRVARGDTMSVEFADLLTQLANDYYYLGRYAQSDSVNRRVLALAPSLLPAAHPLRGDAWMNLGANAQDRSEFDEAVRLESIGVRIIERWYGPDHSRTASAWGTYGRALLRTGREEEATGYFHRALAIRERVYGPDHPRVANLLNDLANLDERHGRLDEAVARYRRIIDIYQRAYNGKHAFIGLFRGNLAGVLLRLNRPAEAEREVRAGLAMYEQTLPDDHFYFAIHHVRLSRALLAQGRNAEALAEATDALRRFERQTPPQPARVADTRRLLLQIYEASGDSTQVRLVRRDLEETLPK